MTNKLTPMTVMRLAVTLLILMVFSLASIQKWMEGMAPEWFIEQFSQTWMGGLPQTPMYLGIAFVEGLVALAACVSLFMLEWLRPPAELLRWTLVGTMFIFIMLGFGARISGQFEDAAFHFLYFAGTLLMFLVIDSSDRQMVA